jgi:hypothetical protein
MAKPDYVALDAGRLAELASRLWRCAQVEAAYSADDPMWLGFSGSVADVDRHYRGPLTDRSWSGRTVSTAYAAAHVGLIAVAEHALCLARLLTDPALPGTLGIEVICRSAVEIAGRSWYLMEPRISPADRVARHLSDQIYSAYEAERMADAMGWAEGVSGISPDVADIARICDELGLVWDQNRANPTVGGQKRPASTVLVAQLIGDTIYAPSRHLVYRLTSARCQAPRR